MNTTLADPNIPDLSPVMSSPEIVSHVQNAFSSLPAPVQDAIDHAHGLLSVAKTAQAEPAPNTSAMPAPESNESPFAGIKLPMGRATGDGNPRMVGQTVKPDTQSNIPFSGPKFAPYNPQTGENYGNNPALHDLIERPGTEKTAITPLPNARADQPTDPTLLAKAEGGIAPPSVPQIAATPALPVAAPEMAAPAVVAPPPSVTPVVPSRVAPAPHAKLSEMRAPDRLAYLQNTGSGVSQVHNPFLRTLATIGDVVGSGLFPGFAQFVPGTSAHHQALVGQTEQQVADEAAEQKARDESARSKAEVTHLEGEAPPTITTDKGIMGWNPATKQYDIPEGKPAPKEEMEGKTITTSEGIMAWNPTTKKYDTRVGSAPEDKGAITHFIDNGGNAWKLNHDGSATPIKGPSGEQIKGAPTGPEGERPLTNVDQMNKQLEERYHVLHPGLALPEHFRIPVGATQKDYDRIDNALNSTERALGTKAQQDQVNEMRRQTMAIAQGKADAAKANIPSAVENVNPKLMEKTVAGYQKISDEYQNAQSANDDIQTALDEAKKGNKLAYAYEPVLGVLTINTAAGVKRINMPEIASYAGAGSLGDRIMGYFGKQTSGASIPDNILKDMGAFHQSLADNAKKKYNSKIDIINKTYGANYPHESGTASGSGQAVKKVTTQSEYDALPKGTKYVDSDGRSGTKK